MISRIHGTLLTRDLDRVEVLTPGGVAYEIAIPLPVYERLPTPGEGVELRVFQVVREDAVLLFGFLDEADRAIFARLLGASGVGPRLAQAVLTVHPPDAVRRALATEDLTALCLVPGVGRKGAQRMVLELKDKAALAGSAGASGATSAGGWRDTLTSALVGLGWSTPQADEVVVSLATDHPDAGGEDVPRLLREALALLARRR